MSVVDHSKPEEFLLFVRNNQMLFATTGMIETDAKVQYICPFVHGKALRQFD